jgi:hypothetical protein
MQKRALLIGLIVATIFSPVANSQQRYVYRPVPNMGYYQPRTVVVPPNRWVSPQTVYSTVGGYVAGGLAPCNVWCSGAVGVGAGVVAGAVAPPNGGTQYYYPRAYGVQTSTPYMYIPGQGY